MIENRQSNRELPTKKPQSITKRTISDSVFTHLFADKKYLLQLYKTLHPEDTEVTQEELTYVTISNILTDGIYNDLGFMRKKVAPSAGEKFVILIEAQSTFTVNIVVRALLYLAQTYQDYIRDTEQNLYNSKRVCLPKPELYVIFTGDRSSVPEYISFAKEFFGGQNCAVEVKVKVITHSNEEDIVGQYIIFTKVYHEQMKLYGRSRTTVKETIRVCMSKGVLTEYLKKREREVADIMMALFDQEEVFQVYVKEERKEAAREAAREGELKGTIEMCQKFNLSMTDTIAEVASRFNLSPEESEEKTLQFWK